MFMLLLAVAAEAAPIDFETAVRSALEDAPRTVIVDEELRLSRAQAQSLPAFDNPSAEVERIADGTELRVSIPVPLSTAPFARLQAAGAGRSAADARFDRDRAELAFQVGLAYLDAVAADERAALAAQSRSDAERVREAVIRLNEAGELSDVDRAVTEAVAAGSVRDAVATEQASFAARVRLEALLGREPTGELDPEGWPTLATPEDIDASGLPGVRAESEEARAAHALRTATLLDRVPTPSLVVGNRFGAEPGPIYGVAIELPILSPGIGAVRSASAQARISEAEADITLLDTVAAVASAHRQLDAAEQAWAAVSSVGGLDQALIDITNALSIGEYSALDFTARRGSILDALESRIDARYRLESARLDLWRLAGQLPSEVSR